MPTIRIPLSVVRSVPKHYTWFMVEGTPPIQARLANSSTRLEGGAMVKGLKFTQTGNYTILAKNDAGNSSKTVDVNVMGRALSQANMLICRAIFQHHPVILVLFFAHIQRLSWSNESTVLLLNWTHWWCIFSKQRWRFQHSSLQRNLINTFGLKFCPCFSLVAIYLRQDALTSQIAGIYVEAGVLWMVLGKSPTIMTAVEAMLHISGSVYQQQLLICKWIS